ncbi:somatostatin 1.2 [Nelusetta ayraudi]|uniref:somatostatin 1.2 n=1 Tax=Nelusetta ayraudi TaxID=303726 RepID=UPI003F703186
MQCVRCPVILALIASVLCSPAVSSQLGRDQNPNLDKSLDLDQDQDLQMELELQQHRLLQQARSAGLLSEDWTKRSVENLLAQMSEAGAQRGSEVIPAGSRVNLERSVDAPNNSPPRERKAGCKNFYWKGYTSC